ncbi:unnamed protein product [Effrenium voratum]|nr:unnamed protein product [Effrenium voratum]
MARPLPNKRPTFNLIYSTDWRPSARDLDPSLPPELQQATAALSAKVPLCCELTDLAFSSLLARQARLRGFQVRRWPVRGQRRWRLLASAAREGRIGGASVLLLHAWHGGFQKDCVPAWEFYPVLKALRRSSCLLYPSASLDELHSGKRCEARSAWCVSLGLALAGLSVIEGPTSVCCWRSFISRSVHAPKRKLRPKLSGNTGTATCKKPWRSCHASHARAPHLPSCTRYSSALMPPTQYLTLKRAGEDWLVGGQSVQKAALAATKAVLVRARSAGLTTENVMVKQGFSWGGQNVTRLRPEEVPEFLLRRVIPKIPQEAAELTVLVQAKIEVAGELRWMVLDGQLRGRGWTTLPAPRLGRTAATGCYKNAHASREALKRSGLIHDTDSLTALEESLRPKVEQVVEEVRSDAKGKLPQYLRVDLLVDKQGRAWLGERESWGADLVKNQKNPLGRTDPTRTELARAIVQKAAQHSGLSS